MSKVFLRPIGESEDVRSYLRYLVRELTHILENVDEDNLTEQFAKSLKEEDK